MMKGGHSRSYSSKNSGSDDENDKNGNDENEGEKSGRSFVEKHGLSAEDLRMSLEASVPTADAASASDGFSDVPGARKGGKKLVIVFTCKVCNTRSAKQFTEQAYNHGVVIVRCPSCENLHLIADRLGFFEDESWDVQKAMAKMGEHVRAVTDDNVLELTLGDVVGNKGTAGNDASGDEPSNSSTHRH